MVSPVSFEPSREAVSVDDPALAAAASRAEVCGESFLEEKASLAEDCDECSRGVTSRERMLRVDEALKETC